MLPPDRDRPPLTPLTPLQPRPPLTPLTPLQPRQPLTPLEPRPLLSPRDGVTLRHPHALGTLRDPRDANGPDATFGAEFGAEPGAMPGAMPGAAAGAFPRPLPGAGARPPLSPLGAAPARPPGTAPRANRAGPVYRGLPLPVRLVLWVAAAAAIGWVIGATAPTALQRLGAVAALQPGLLAWYTVRALGFLAYLVVAGSVLYGLLLSTKILDAIAHRPVSFALHKDLAIVGFVLAILHATVLLADQSFAFTPRAILVPFASPYAAVWVGIGQLTFYGLAVITASFYVRRQIGQRAWRLLHYLTFLVFIGAIGHGVMSGSDSGASWAFWLYLAPGASAVFLLVYRIVVSISMRLSHSGGDRAAAPSPLVTRAPIQFPGGRVPSGRPATPLEPPFAGPTFD
jgi:DMSO/TMAO reductase YedYZ heme-binding membrane subunit